MASSGGDTHYCIISFVIMGTRMVLLNIKFGEFIITSVMITNGNSADCPLTGCYL